MEHWQCTTQYFLLTSCSLQISRVNKSQMFILGQWETIYGHYIVPPFDPCFLMAKANCKGFKSFFFYSAFYFQLIYHLLGG